MFYNKYHPFLMIVLHLALFGLPGCSTVTAEPKIVENDPNTCPVTEPLWVMPPDDAAVSNEPAYGHYYVNENETMMAAAWWHDDYFLEAGPNGNKTGWFRPAGETLTITGQRLDGDAPPMQSSVPCCYPTQFQATGLIFPTEGCWQVDATAADETLSFIVWVGRKT